jgi:hypothetical protein
MTRRSAIPLTWLMAPLLLAGCSSDSDPGPGGVTKGEAKQLDAAAAMLDKRPAAPLIDATVPADIGDGEATLPTLKTKPGH